MRNWKVFVFCLAAASITAEVAQAQTVTQVPAVRPVPVQWRAQAELAAHLTAAEEATLAPVRGGVVSAVNFQSGAAVRQGQVLVVLDIGQQQAQLALDQAKLVQSTRNLARTEKLMTISGASQAALDQAQAALAEDEAQIRLDKAEVAQGEIIAPFAGTAGIRAIDPGDYLQAGQTVVTLIAPGRLKVYFTVPQSEAASLMPGEEFSFIAPLGAGETVIAPGTLTAISPALDSKLDARDAEGRLGGEAAALLSGMNGVVKIATGAPVAAYSVPNAALNDSMLGPYVFAISPEQGGFVLHSLYVKILDSAGKNSIVSAPGLKAGQKIVALGGFKLNDGQQVSLAAP